MKYSLSTVESSQSGFIRQSFLDNELEHGLRKVENLTRDLTDEVNHALRRISDIMPVPTIRDEGFIYKVRQAMKHKEDTIERLQRFDQRQTHTLLTVNQDFTKLKNCVYDIQAMFKSKQIKLTTFKINQLSNIEPYNDIRARLEYEDAVQLIKEKLNYLFSGEVKLDYIETFFEVSYEIVPSIFSKPNVSSIIEENDLKLRVKDISKYNQNTNLTEEQIKVIHDSLTNFKDNILSGLSMLPVEIIIKFAAKIRDIFKVDNVTKESSEENNKSEDVNKNLLDEYDFITEIDIPEIEVSKGEVPWGPGNISKVGKIFEKSEKITKNVNKSTENLNRKDAFNIAKDLAGVPRSQQPSRQWVVGDNIIKKGGDYKNYEYNSNPTHHGRYYEYDTIRGKRVIVEHTNDKRLHTHAGKPKGDENIFTYDFKKGKYQRIYGPNGDHHIYYYK